jgi:hypothetical protein
MWQKHKIHLANFDQSTLRASGFVAAPLLGCRHIEMTRERQIETLNGVFVRCDHVASGIVNADHSVV